MPTVTPWPRMPWDQTGNTLISSPAVPPPCPVFWRFHCCENNALVGGTGNVAVSRLRFSRISKVANRRSRPYRGRFAQRRCLERRAKDRSFTPEVGSPTDISSFPRSVAPVAPPSLAERERSHHPKDLEMAEATAGLSAASLRTNEIAEKNAYLWSVPSG